MYGITKYKVEPVHKYRCRRDPKRTVYFMPRYPRKLKKRLKRAVWIWNNIIFPKVWNEYLINHNN